jgi:hypothetical protein
MHHLVIIATHPLLLAAAQGAGRRIVRWLVLLILLGTTIVATVHFSRRHRRGADETGAKHDEWPRNPGSRGLHE